MKRGRVFSRHHYFLREHDLYERLLPIGIILLLALSRFECFFSSDIWNIKPWAQIEINRLHAGRKHYFCWFVFFHIPETLFIIISQKKKNISPPLIIVQKNVKTGLFVWMVIFFHQYQLLADFSFAFQCLTRLTVKKYRLKKS